MGDKIRGTIAIVVGVFALWQSYVLYTAGRVDWHMWVEVAAGLVLIIIGIWRVRRKAEDAAAELLK
jgi:ABC-type nickel/cobalt efflux system permease component RcnA